MTFVAFTIPDDPAHLPNWLERRLVAADFGRLIAELAAAYPGRGRTRVPARQLLGDWYRPALIDGLKSVPVGVLQQLLRHPNCLLELQEAVLIEGGSYWDEVAEQAEELTPTLERGKVVLESLFEPAVTNAARTRENAKARPTPASPSTASPSLTIGVRPERPARSYFTWAVVNSSLAACLLIAVGYLTLRGNKPGSSVEVAGVSWGWAKPGGIPRDQPKPVEYLNGLASTANEWFDKRPEDAASVAQRINEFRTGCSQLIFSPHASLAPTDRAWLIEKCRSWATKLDDHLTALENGADPLKVRADADETIRKLQGALRERATQVG